MRFSELQVGMLYEWTSSTASKIRNWTRVNQDDGGPHLKSYPAIEEHSLFVLLEAVQLPNEYYNLYDLYDLKIISPDGTIGWLFLWNKEDSFPMKEKVECQ
jgi:hypothetical protein